MIVNISIENFLFINGQQDQLVNSSFTAAPFVKAVNIICKTDRKYQNRRKNSGINMDILDTLLIERNRDASIWGMINKLLLQIITLECCASFLWPYAETKTKLNLGSNSIYDV